MLRWFSDCSRMPALHLLGAGQGHVHGPLSVYVYSPRPRHARLQSYVAPLTSHFLTPLLPGILSTGLQLHAKQDSPNPPEWCHDVCR